MLNDFIKVSLVLIGSTRYIYIYIYVLRWFWVFLAGTITP